jgi:hypothetical protein
MRLSPFPPCPLPSWRAISWIRNDNGHPIFEVAVPAGTGRYATSHP